jgi:polyribonucleotide nucleotidyltransferase
MPTVVSADLINDPDTLAMVAASAAGSFRISFAGPIAAVRVGRVDGRLIANPTRLQMAESDMEAHRFRFPDAVMMVEGEADLVSGRHARSDFLRHAALQPLIDMQLKLQELVGKPSASSRSPRRTRTRGEGDGWRAAAHRGEQNPAKQSATPPSIRSRPK